MALAAMAGVLSVTDAPAAQQGRPGTTPAPFHHAAPMFHPAPVQHAPPNWGAGRPPHVAPFAPPSPGANVPAVNPYRVPPDAPFNHPGALRPNLPFNGPGALRPNFPLNTQGTHEPGNPASGLPAQQGSAASPPGPGASGAGASQPLASTPPPATPPLAGQPPAPVRQPVVIRPLLKAPPGGFQQTRPVFPAVQRNDRFWPLHKDRRFIWMHGERRAFVPVALLGVILIGDSYWYPDGYVSMEGPACTGATADGCQLEWREVALEDGGSEPQCVQYCPQAGPPPVQASPLATLPPPPPLAQGGECRTTIYSEPNFAGNSAPTGDSQPILSTTGWRNEIASIVVGAGAWDFFADENFGGESLRLSPGTYPTLPPEWTRRIGSFMCVEPGPPPA
jgi:hypothetical protein